MPYFFCEENLTAGKQVAVAGQEARHLLLSHRLKKGEMVKLQGPNKKRFLCAVKEVHKERLLAEAVSELAVPAEPSTEMVLFQAVVSEKALDFIFQKGTELGLSKIVLFNSANTATKISLDTFSKKAARWQKILSEAAKQSERVKWPELTFVSGLPELAEKIQTLEQVYLADIDGQVVKPGTQTGKSLGIIIGPEGGFLSEEVLFLKDLKNLRTVNLGPILLRAETAALSAIAKLTPPEYL